MKHSPRRAFFVNRITAIASSTVRVLIRLKTFHVLFLFTLLLIGGSIWMSQFTFQEEFQVLKDIAFGSMSIFTSLLAVLSTAQLIPSDLEDRTLYTILAKPVARIEYLLGKLAGVLLLLAWSMIIMSLLFLIVLKAREQAVLHQTAQQLQVSSPEQMTEALKAVRNAAFNRNLCPVLLVIYLKACLLAALTLFISTFATTTIFSATTMMFVYLIGHLQSIARTYWLEGSAPGWMTRGFLALITLFFPDLQLFNLADDAVAGVAIPMTLLARTIALGCFYTGFYLLLAWLVFAQKEL